MVCLRAVCRTDNIRDMTFGSTIRNGISVGVGATPSLGQTSYFTPDQIQNLAAWYRFNTGITQAGGFASAWADQSGNGRNLVQASGANQPSVNPDGSLLFNGTSQTMRVLFTLPQPATVCVLAKPISWTSQDRLWSGAGGASWPRVQQTASNSTVQYANTSGTAAVAYTNNVYSVFLGVANNTASIISINNTERTGGSGTTALDGFTLCASGLGGAAFGNFEVKEVVVYSFALNLWQRRLMTRYLAMLGGLQT